MNPDHPPLSPAAQAGELILAYRRGADEVPHSLGIAAALRAAADQVLPDMEEPDWGASDNCDIELYAYHQRKRSAFLAIAAELEGAP